MTVHKSQGLEFEKVHVDLNKCWTGRVAYVALSRARSLAGLSLSNMSRGWCHERLEKFFDADGKVSVQRAKLLM